MGKGFPDLDAERAKLLECASDEELLARSIPPQSFRDRMPFEWREEIVVLGVTLDPLLTFRAHIEGLLSKVKIRHGVMSAITKTNWGLETNWGLDPLCPVGQLNPVRSASSCGGDVRGGR